jgi:hypothetical protein
MDEIVKQAIAKWPNVPHCYGWLALDARGNWRMRDERAQHLKLPGDKLTHPALVAFINRNYDCDERGCWFFQNGPQRVYVTLEATPFIARTDPQAGLLLHTGEPAGQVDLAYLSDAGQFIVHTARGAAQLDDRDVSALISRLTIDGKAASDDALLAWLGGATGTLRLGLMTHDIAIQRILNGNLGTLFSFVGDPGAVASD